MPETLDRLHQEHRELARLLDILEHELGRFDAAEKPDYEVMQAIADYFTDFPAACHHPKEDLVYRALVERRPDIADTVGDLVAEHAEIAVQVRRFAEAVRDVLHDVGMTRDTFDAVIRDFLRRERQHIELEETKFFPLAAEVLTEADWAKIDARATDREDPLFGAQPEARFATLRRDIEEWEAEATR